MTALVVVLVALWAFIVIAMLLVLTRMILLTFQEVQSQKGDHAKCMAMVAAYVGDEFAAQVLRAAAADYESVEEQVNLKRLAREQYQAGGPSMPAIWLEDRANTLSPRPVNRGDFAPEYRLDGSRIII